MANTIIRVDDDETDWMADLDWSEHGSTSVEWVSDHIFFADAAKRLASKACAVWPDTIPFFLYHASNRPAGPLVSAEEAFLADGTPVASLHHDLAPLMRDHASRLRVGIVDPNVISRSEWEAIIDAGAMHWSDGTGARVAAAGIAPLLARMAKDRQIDTLCCPLDGGDEEMRPIAPELWSVPPRVAIVRLAKCGFDPQRPRDPDAAITHRIFVSKRNFVHAVTAAARQNYVAVSFPEHELPRDVDNAQLMKMEISAALCDLMRNMPHATKPDLIDQLSLNLRIKIGDDRFKDAYRSLRERGKLPYELKPGRPPAK